MEAHWQLSSEQSPQITRRIPESINSLQNLQVLILIPQGFATNISDILAILDSLIRLFKHSDQRDPFDSDVHVYRGCPETMGYGLV